MDSDKLTEQLNRVGRTEKVFLLIRLAGMAGLAAVLVAGLIYNRSVINALVSYDMVTGLLAYLGDLWNAAPQNPGLYGVQFFQLLGLLVTLGLFVIAVATILLQGLRIILSTAWTSIVDVRDDVRPRIPEKFADLDEVALALVEHTLVVPDQKSAFLKAAFKSSASYVPPTTRPVVSRAGERLNSLSGKLIRLAIGAIIVIGGGYWLHLDQTLAMLEPTIAGALSYSDALTTAWRFVIPFSGLALLTALIAALDMKLISSLVPRQAPGCASDNRVADFIAGTKYNNILSQLPLRFNDQHALPGHPNAVVMLSAETASETISDSGQFEARMVIEQQPVPTTRPARQAALWRLVAGWALLIAGAFVGLFLVLQTAAAYLAMGLEVKSPSFLLSPIAAILFLTLSRNMRAAGIGFIAESAALAQVQRYMSLLLLLRLSGTQSRAEVKVGRAQDDSIESSSEITRLELLAEVWAAEVHSEAAGLHGEREVVATAVSPGSSDWANDMLSHVRDLCERKTRTIAVDVTSDSTGEILRSNLGMAAARAHNSAWAGQQALPSMPVSDPAILPAPDHPQALLTATGTPPAGGFAADGSVLPGHKLCPDCAEAVKELARKCRFCGHAFDQPAETTLE